ncbi:hypothetical protein BU26DRAFT_162013 [Trematosphaeria pertusa]|uniref:Uncharacterized protein n=1 Tax=Trematosphaeria pertusa TaxID=390896 RepID=A0A6A6HV00_9PLEO|nr:uncharacterized protein BU26DRAFT_162013 [Trematosphaeria pertusa]KAF2241936.1 hypothetical protein BU26DRAFT_162013 [Trematosphaeria pertusa]
MWGLADKKYKGLKGMGGRPSREINPDPGPCPPPKSDVDKEYHVRDHWGREHGRLRDEIARWVDFRWHQFKKREDSKIFNKYKEAVHGYQQNKGIDWDVELQLDRQTKLDEWREYYLYEHRKRGALEKELEHRKQKLVSAKERMGEAERNRSVGIHPNALLARWRELIEYKKKISQAQKEVDMAQKRLKVLRVEESRSAVEKDIMIAQAEEDLESAQKSLEAQKSDELDQLKREDQRVRAQEALATAQGNVSCANTRLEQLDTLLEWIAGQFADIATEYVSSSWGGKHNRDLLEGWEKYYAYMRERLQAKQDWQAKFLQYGWTKGRTEAEEARDDWLDPQERIRPIKALLAWIEREFPEIAAQYAPSSQDSPSSGDNQNQAILPSSKPSPSEAPHKASRLDRAGKRTPRKGKSAREQSPLHQVQLSKVSKPRQRGRRPPNQKRSTTRDSVGNAVGQEEEESHKAAVRRSARISQQTRNPESPSPPFLRATKTSSRSCPDGIVRRSARISDRTKKKPRPLGADQEVEPVQSRTPARRKSARRIATSTNAAYSGMPQGISKTTRRRKTATAAAATKRTRG